MSNQQSEKDLYLTGYSYVLGTPEAEKAWQEKCIFMCRRWPDHSLYEYYKSQIDGTHQLVMMEPSMVIEDLKPYQSMIDGSMITSRSQHRNHLKRHNCFEVGNETKHLKKAEMKSPPGLKEELIKQVHQKLR